MHTTWMLEQELTELDPENKDYLGVLLSVCFLIGEHVDESITQDRIVSTATHWRCLICNRRKSSPDSGWALCILSSMHFGAGEQLTLLCWGCPTPLFCEGTNDTAARMLPCHPQAWSPMCISDVKPRFRALFNEAAPVPTCLLGQLSYCFLT